MIPFGRMVQYGNTAPVPSKIIDFIIGNDYIASLSDSGKLYMCGAYVAGSLGYENGRNFVEVRGDVKVMYGNSGSLTIQTFAGEWYYLGYSSYSSASSAGTRYNTWTNVTSLYNGIDLTGTSIKYVVVGGLDTYVLTNNNKLYAIGKNYNGNFGRGDTTGSSTFVLLRSDVVDIVSSDPNYWGATVTAIRTTNNSIYICGNVVSNNLTSFILVDTGTNLCLDNANGSSSSGVRYIKNNKWNSYSVIAAYHSGIQASYGSVGSVLEINYPRLYTSIGNSRGGNGTSNFALFGTEVYGSGANAGGSTGTGVSGAVTVYTKVLDADVLKTDSYNNASGILNKDGELYLAGDSSRWSSGTGNQTTFIKVKVG